MTYKRPERTGDSPLVGGMITPNVRQEWMALHGTSTKHDNELESLEIMFTMLVSLTIVYHSPARSCYSFMVRGVIDVTTQRQVYGLFANWDEPASRAKQTFEGSTVCLRKYWEIAHWKNVSRSSFGS